MKKALVVWGTGQEADRLMKWLSIVNLLSKKTLGTKICDVRWFLDSNKLKINQKFYGKEIRLPETIWYGKTNLVVVAVVKNEEIVSMLEQHGYSRMENYLTLEDFYVWLWRDSGVTWRLVKCLVPGNDFVSGLFESIVPQDIPSRFERLQRRLRVAYGKIDCNVPLDYLQDMVVFSVLFADCDWPDREAMGKKLMDLVGIPRFMNLLELVFRDRTDIVAKWMPRSSKNVSKRVLPNTIALYYTRYYNGGIERVISKLLQLFHVHGYQLVFFTDEIREDLEYPLPDGVKRVIVGHEGGRQGRCERLIQALRDYNVDLFCSHARGINAFYDLLCVQQIGVPIVLELHNNFSFLDNMPNERILSMGRRVDVLVTLSRVDAMFWYLLGCRSIYVPNPVDPPEETQIEPAPYTILCLQRIDQVQKQVFELPAILEYVVQTLPEARLHIVGKADNPDIEVRLRNMFEERGLMENVDFLGFHVDVAKYYRQASVMLMTSRFEGFPMTVAESKRYGIPLVMYELPYLELLRDGRGYIAVSQNDKKGAANALVQVLSNSGLRKCLSKEAKASLEDFSKLNLMVEWEKVFTMAMREKKDVVLSEKERMLGEIERLLLELAERLRSGGQEL